MPALLGKPPRFKLHLAPRSASRPNLVELFFAEIMTRRVRHRSYSSTDALEGEIYEYLLQHNAKPTLVSRSKAAKDVLAHERRGLDPFEQIRVDWLQLVYSGHEFGRPALTPDNHPAETRAGV